MKLDVNQKEFKIEDLTSANKEYSEKI